MGGDVGLGLPGERNSDGGGLSMGHCEVVGFG
jgi:hypothetical protein